MIGCGACNGNGYIDEGTYYWACNVCGGTGVISVTKRKVKRLTNKNKKNKEKKDEKSNS
jgi:RecJ-like exonuclease